MPVKGLGRQAKSSLYRWVAVRLLQKKKLDLPADFVVLDSDSIVNVDDGLFGENELCSYHPLPEIRSLTLRRSTTPQDHSKNDANSSSSFFHCLSPVKIFVSEPILCKNDAFLTSEKKPVPTDSLRDSSSLSSFGYEPAITENGTSYDDVNSFSLGKPLPPDDETLNSINSSFPSVFELSTKDLPKNILLDEENIISSTFPNMQYGYLTSEGSETLSDNNEEFPSEALSKIEGHSEMEKNAMTSKEDKRDVSLIMVTESDNADSKVLYQELNTETSFNFLASFDNSENYDKTEVDAPKSVLEESSGTVETPTRARVVRNRLLNEIISSHGSVQSVIAQAIGEKVAFVRKWESVGVLYGQELVDVRAKVRARLICILKEREERKRQKREMKYRNRKRRQMRRKLTPTPPPEERQNDENKVDKEENKRKEKSLSESFSCQYASDSLSKCDRRLSEENNIQNKYFPSEIPSLKPEKQNILSESKNFTSSIPTDKDRFSRGSPPPSCPPRRLRKTLTPVQESKDVSIIFRCCPFLSAIKRKFSKHKLR